MLNIPFALVPVIVGAVLIITWALNAEPPIPIWYLFLFGGGLILFIVMSFLAFHQMRKERDNALLKIPVNQMADEILIKSKIPQVLEITDTLQKMADYHDAALNKLFGKKVKARKLAKIQSELRERHNINGKFKDSNMGNTAKIKVIHNQVKKLGLYDKDFQEGIVPFMVEVTWTLNDFDVGIPQYLEHEDYQNIKSLLESQTRNIASDDLEEMILSYEDLSIGFGSMIAYINYFPKSYKTDWIPIGINKTKRQLKYERDQILRTYLQKISKEIEHELKR